LDKIGSVLFEAAELWFAIILIVVIASVIHYCVAARNLKVFKGKLRAQANQQQPDDYQE
jgi:L-asparagine transporter-like permease